MQKQLISVCFALSYKTFELQQYRLCIVIPGTRANLGLFRATRCRRKCLIGVIHVSQRERRLELKSIGRFYVLTTEAFFSFVVLQTFCSPAARSADDTSFLTDLTRQNIARNALSIAETTNSYGYCYAAVARAVRPFGINLHGNSAFMAAPILLKDNRFDAMKANEQVALSVGDIVVYNATRAHPHGHIAIYEGYGTEASDHIAALTPYSEYEGATIFRLKQGCFAANKRSAQENEFIRIAPDFRPPSQANKQNASKPEQAPFKMWNGRNHKSKVISRLNLNVLKSKVLRFIIQSI